MLKLNEELVSEPTRLKEHVTNFFTLLFDRSQRNHNGMSYELTGLRRLDEREALGLIKRATNDEVKRAVKGMKRFGNPGPDGIPTAFYQKYREVAGPSITDLVNKALSTKRIPEELLSAFITLILKKESPENAEDFRLITLLNVSLKIIYKVIVNRMRPIMQDII